jgi:hypothetical protein
MTTTFPARDAIKQAVEGAQKRLSSPLQTDRFAAKIRLASAVKSKCEEFNIWHAAADNKVDNGVDSAWGSMAKRVG